ncbi:hypothetical protein, partial [Microvirga arabica]
ERHLIDVEVAVADAGFAQIVAEGDTAAMVLDTGSIAVAGECEGLPLAGSPLMLLSPVIICMSVDMKTLGAGHRSSSVDFG